MMCSAIVTPASFSRDHTGSKYGSPGLRPYAGPVGISTTLAPRARMSSVAAIASVEIAQRQQRGGVELVLVVEPPRLVVPAVERCEVGVQGVGVGDVVLGGERHAGREQHAALDALLLEQSQPWFALEVLDTDRLGLVGLVGVAGCHLLEHLLQAARPVGEVEPEARTRC